MDEKKAPKIQEELEKIKGIKELALKKSQEELNKIDQGRNPQTYAEGEQEVNARKKELEDINSEIESFNKANEDIKDSNIEAIKKDKIQKTEALKKAKDELAKLNSVKDPKSYKDVQNEVERRQKELNEVDEKYKEINNKEKDLKDLIETFNKKYHIDKKEQENNEQGKSEEQAQQETSKKEEKGKNNNTDNENKDDNNGTLAKQIAEKEAEVRVAEKRMANFGRSGFDGQTELEKYKKLMKELEELKSGKVNKEDTKKDAEAKKKDKKYYSPTQEEIEEYMELRNKGYDDNSPEMKEFFKNLAEKRTNKPERDENGNLKYPPVEQKTPTLPVKTTEQTKLVKKDDSDKKLSIIYSGKDNKYIVSNFEKILAEVKFENENDKLNHIKNMTQKLSKPIDAINFKNKKEKLEYLKNEFNEEELTHIFGEKYKKTMKKMAKTCDPQLLVLLADLDMNFAKKYISELSKGKEDEKEELPYSMKYNLKGMRKNHKENKMSFIQRIRTNRMAKKNYQKGVAEYVADDKSRKWLAVPVIGVLAAGGLAITNNDKTPEKPNQDHTPEITDTTPDISVGKATEKQEQAPTIPSDEIEKAVEQAFNDTDKNNTDDLSLGSKVKLSAGVTYTEDSLGNGLTGKIGELSWRPAGDYTIDRVAIYYNGTLLENLSTEGTNVDEAVRKYAKELGVDSSKIVQKAHVCLGEKHNGATGWLNMEEVSMQDLKNNISKTYEELQQEKAANSKQQSQKTNQEQNHEDRE